MKYIVITITLVFIGFQLHLLFNFDLNIMEKIITFFLLFYHIIGFIGMSMRSFNDED
jgi:hypothetical protein